MKEIFIWYIIFAVYTQPLMYFRYKFRSIVYKDSSWSINVKPWFVKETVALVTGKYFATHQQNILWAYRAYLLGAAILLIILVRVA